MNDVRWFAPNAYTRLITGELRRRGLSIAHEGDEPARLALSIPPHREFVASAARLVPPDDDGELVEAIRRALEDEAPSPDSVRELTISAAADRFIASLQLLLG